MAGPGLRGDCGQIQKTKWDQFAFCEYGSICGAEHLLTNDFAPAMEATANDSQVPPDIAAQLREGYAGGQSYA